MQTVVIDGKEYVLVPKEAVQPSTIPPVVSTPQNIGVPSVPQAPETAISPLDDFLSVSDLKGGVDDGLATQQEKETLIRVVEPPKTQDVVVSVIPNVPKVPCTI